MDMGAPEMPDPKRVLIAEDDPAIARMIALLVEDVGATPMVAHDGRGALALARGTPPTIVITDLMMPNLDGAGLVKALREDAAADGSIMPPVILITAANRTSAQAVRADALLWKPFELADLDALLQRYLD